MTTPTAPPARTAPAYTGPKWMKVVAIAALPCALIPFLGLVLGVIGLGAGLFYRRRSAVIMSSIAVGVALLVTIAVVSSPTPTPAASPAAGPPVPAVVPPVQRAPALAPAPRPIPAQQGAAAAPAAQSPTDASMTSYAIAGYELGVKPVTGGADPVCPSEVASWQKSLLSDGTSVSVSARGPVQLSVNTTLRDGTKSTQKITIDSDHSEAIVQFADSPVINMQEATITASDGGQGKGSSCVAAMPSNTQTFNQYCKGKHWPLSIPGDVIGLNWSDATSSARELGCFNVTKSISDVDGHDVGDETIQNMHPSKIVSIDPPVGSKIMSDTPINLRVHPTDR